jgi:hypothetical protein
MFCLLCCFVFVFVGGGAGQKDGATEFTFRDEDHSFHTSN